MAGFSFGGGNYTGMLTRSIVFSAALIVFLAGEWYGDIVNRRLKSIATGMTLASIIVPEWISFHSETVCLLPLQ